MLFFFFLAVPHGIWDLISPAKDQTHIKGEWGVGKMPYSLHPMAWKMVWGGGNTWGRVEQQGKSLDLWTTSLFSDCAGTLLLLKDFL